MNLRGSFAGNEADRRGAGDAQQAKNRTGYACNVRDEDRYRADGGRKSLADHRADYLELLGRAGASGADIGKAECAVLDDLALAALLAVRADADRRLAEIIAAGPDSWLYDDHDRAMAETEALESIALGDGLLADAKGTGGLTDADLAAPMIAPTSSRQMAAPITSSGRDGRPRPRPARSLPSGRRPIPHGSRADVIDISAAPR